MLLRCFDGLLVVVGLHATQPALDRQSGFHDLGIVHAGLHDMNGRAGGTIRTDLADVLDLVEPILETIEGSHELFGAHRHVVTRAGDSAGAAGSRLVAALIRSRRAVVGLTGGTGGRHARLRVSLIHAGLLPLLCGHADARLCIGAQNHKRHLAQSRGGDDSDRPRKGPAVDGDGVALGNTLDGMHVGPYRRLALVAGGRELPDRIRTVVDREDAAVDLKRSAVGADHARLAEDFLEVVAVRIDNRHGLLELHARKVNHDRIGRPRLAEHAAGVSLHREPLDRGVAFGGGRDPLRRRGQQQNVAHASTSSSLRAIRLAHVRPESPPHKAQAMRPDDG